uniref:Uncharacterized protein n=1 Tax=Romanomermis culicivorax TaxID=13658 RepID=A0A915JYQ4_ROMCU
MGSAKDLSDSSCLVPGRVFSRVISETLLRPAGISNMTKEAIVLYPTNYCGSLKGASYNKDSVVLHGIGLAEIGEGERAQLLFHTFASMESSTLENIEEETEAINTQPLLQGR